MCYKLNIFSLAVCAMEDYHGFGPWHISWQRNADKNTGEWRGNNKKKVFHQKTYEKILKLSENIKVIIT